MPSINVKLNEDQFKSLKNCKPEGYSWKRYLLSARWIMGRLGGKPEKKWNESWGMDHFEKTKPCHDCGFCPYGQVVEMFPFSEPRGEYSCRVFGHDCPVFSLAEPLAES